MGSRKGTRGGGSAPGTPEDGARAIMVPHTTGEVTSKADLGRIADEVLCLDPLPNDDRPQIIQQLERSRWLTAQMLNEIERLSRKYSEAKSELSLLTHVEEETMKISKLHVKVVEREVRTLTKDPATDDVVKEVDTLDNDRVRLLRENILEHQKQVKRELHKELLEKRLLLSHKEERNKHLRQEIAGAVERQKEFDDEDAKEGAHRRRQRVRKEDAAAAVASTEKPMNEWLQSLRGTTRVPLASVLTGSFPGYGEPVPQPAAGQAVADPQVVGEEDDTQQAPSPANDDVEDVSEYMDMIAKLQTTMQVGMQAKRAMRQHKETQNQRSNRLRNAARVFTGGGGGGGLKRLLNKSQTPPKTETTEEEAETIANDMLLRSNQSFVLGSSMKDPKHFTLLEKETVHEDDAGEAEMDVDIEKASTLTAVLDAFRSASKSPT